jgi:hypothetical protein
MSGKVSEMAEKILSNLQKAMVDSTISTAIIGLEEGSSYSTAYQALSYSTYP